MYKVRSMRLMNFSVKLKPRLVPEAQAPVASSKYLLGTKYLCTFFRVG